ncbi:hypothetical protein IJG29_04310 [Candidatus Saccharibacteria bacterium]|nr:hypothetical protein [Candidatus Saccharibacteria bacterium]
MEYLQRIEKNPYSDILWNVPEQKQGVLAVIGGNSQNFRTPVKIAEYLSAKYPVHEVRVILPDVLRGKVPELANFIFAKSTESGSVADGAEIDTILDAADYGLVIGDLSKNSITGSALVSAYESSDKPILITRDAVDLLAENCTETTLMRDGLMVVASMAQVIKLFRAVYYPKMVTLSQSMVQVAEALHKFTMSYPLGIVTLQSGQLLVAKDGAVNVVPLDITSLTPLSLWMGETAARIAALNMYNPGKFIEAAVTALLD